MPMIMPCVAVVVLLTARASPIDRVVGLSVAGFERVHRVFLVMRGVSEADADAMRESGKAIDVAALPRVERPVGKFAVEWGALPLN